MSNFSDFFGGGGIKSIQRGVATPTSPGELSVTVTAVNPAKSMLNLLSSGAAVFSAANDAKIALRLINATSIGVVGYATDGTSYYYANVSWELIEFA